MPTDDVVVITGGAGAMGLACTSMVVVVEHLIRHRNSHSVDCPGGPPYPQTRAGAPGRRRTASREDGMTRELGFPVFDGDNHLYETRDALTAHLPAEA
jgi:hypothetical protein